MIEMIVRTVDTHPETGRPVAVLGPRTDGAGPLLAFTISPAEACSLSHELSLQATLRGQAFSLLTRCLECLVSRVAAIRIVPAAPGMAAARLELDCPSERTEVPVEVGQAFGLAVALRMPLHVADDLVPGGTGQPVGSLSAAPMDVPTVFRRAFDA